MRSLRRQLILGTALGTAVVLLVSGFVLYTLISRTLRAEFDAALLARAQSLAAFVEQEGSRLESELAERLPSDFVPSEHAEYYQLWLPDGAVFARSPSLQGGDLARVSGAGGDPAFAAATLPDGRAGRIVGLTFVPRAEDENGPPPAPIRVTLVVGRGTVGLQATLARVRGLLIAVCLVAVAVSAWILAGVVRRSLLPVERLGGQISALGAENLSAQIDVAGVPEELSPVVDRLNELLARLHAAFQRERRFTGDVAHELRTPLAGLRAKLELALSRDRTSEAYRQAIDDCLEISHAMQRMVENLLHLARADAGQLEVRRESVDLSEMIRECWKLLDEEANRRGLGVEWRLDGSAPIETDREKLRLVLQNVLGNAVTYTNDKGRICIATSDEDGALVLTASNTGCRLSADEAAHVFDRFWRGDASWQVSEGHCGLGLALCRALIGQLAGTIAATVSAEGTFTVGIHLPRDGSPAARS